MSGESRIDSWSPKFIVIGAMKAASTWLHGCLIRHPELVGPIADKELHFFDEPAHYRHGLDWYRSLFPDIPGRAVGESTPAYMHAPGVHRRVHEAYPKVMLFASLRDPAERAFSHYRYSLYVAGRLSLYGTFEEALDGADELLEFGRYGKHISRWLELFPREQMHLILYEDIKRDPVGTMTAAYRFLELEDTGFQTDHAGEQAHVTGAWKLELANPGLYRQALRLRMALKRVRFADGLLERSGLIRVMRNRLRKGSRRVDRSDDFVEPVFTSEARARIIDEMRDDISRLEDIMERDLTSWKTVE